MLYEEDYKKEEEKTPWTEEDTQKLLMWYKILGSKWSTISHKFPGRSENDVKNRFYTTLKRVATRAQIEDPVRYSSTFIKCKENLVQFVDAAILYGQYLPSKRGRKKNSEKKLAATQSILFPSLDPPNSTNVYPPTASPVILSEPFVIWQSSKITLPSTFADALTKMGCDWVKEEESTIGKDMDKTGSKEEEIEAKNK